jgi:hypothetical protein
MNAEVRALLVWQRLIYPLQWGRIQMNAEVRAHDEQAAALDKASMWPHSDERGSKLPRAVYALQTPGFNGAAFR